MRGAAAAGRDTSARITTADPGRDLGSGGAAVVARGLHYLGYGIKMDSKLCTSHVRVALGTPPWRYLASGGPVLLCSARVTARVEAT